MAGFVYKLVYGVHPNSCLSQIGLEEIPRMSTRLTR